MTRMFSMRRWNNKPTVEHNSEASNSGFVLHTAHLLGMLERSNGRDVDLKKIIVRGTLKDMPKCILSDISLETKRTIKELSPEIWEKVYKSSIDEVLKNVPQEWSWIFEDAMLNSRDDSIEGRILDAADLYAAYTEAEVNNRLFGEHFGDILKSIGKRIEDVELESFKMLLIRSELKEYLTRIRTLMHAIRWNQYSRSVPTTVAGHTLFVVFVSHLIALKSEEADILNVVERALFHDVPEALTGDIISPTKKRVEGFEDVIENVESKMVHEVLLPLLPENISNRYAPLMLDPFGGGIEGRITRAADLIGSMIECKMEIENGIKNQMFERGYVDIKKQLESMGIAAVNETVNSL